MLLVPGRTTLASGAAWDVMGGVARSRCAVPRATVPVPPYMTEKFTVHRPTSRSHLSTRVRTNTRRAAWPIFGRGYATHKQATTEPRVSPIFTAKPRRNYGQIVGSYVRRGTTYVFYTAVVAGGLGLTAVVLWTLYDALLKPSGEVQIYENSMRLVEKHAECRRVLGDKMTFHGESSNRWARNRPPASGRQVDQFGNEHLYMRYTVEGEYASGTVLLEKVRRRSEDEFKYKSLVVEVGDSRIYVIEDAAASAGSNKKKPVTFMGYRLF